MNTYRLATDWSKWIFHMQRIHDTSTGQSVLDRGGWFFLIRKFRIGLAFKKQKQKQLFLCLPIQQQPCIFLWTDYLMTCIGLYSIQCIDLYWPVSTFITGHCLDKHLGSNIVISAEHTSFFFKIRWEIYLSSMYSNHVFEFNVFWACCQRSSFNKSDSQPVDNAAAVFTQ